jgi:hypothetical protein
MPPSRTKVRLSSANPAKATTESATPSIHYSSNRDPKVITNVLPQNLAFPNKPLILRSKLSKCYPANSDVSVCYNSIMRRLLDPRAHQEVQSGNIAQLTWVTAK